MGFMMSNFYLVNWPDADIRRISWEAKAPSRSIESQVISSTVSIFSAVLLFQAKRDSSRIMFRLTRR